MSEQNNVSISAATLVKIVAVFLLLYLAYLILDILVLLFIAVILSSLIDPLADWLEKKKMGRGLAVLLVYAVVLGVLSLIFILLAPIVIEQASQLIANSGDYWQKVVSGFSAIKSLTIRFGLWDNLQTALPSALKGGLGTAQSLIGSLFGFFGGLFSLILVLVITFYMVVEEEGFKQALRSLVPAPYQSYMVQLWMRVKEKLGSWLRGSLFLGLIVGAMSWVGLLILGVEYSLLLAVITGLFELIPYAGPIFAGVIAVVLTFLQTGDWLKPLLVAALFIVIQQLENNLLVPKVMKKAVGLNPIVSIVSLLIGFRLLGIVGALLAIPVASVLNVVWADIIAWRMNHNNPESRNSDNPR